ncbi:MAG TPA: hypothetical protein IGR64_00990 [Leptolyngbyaceae cyanobacterium M65_K2018_010]|nr:hypothetical protein [Leptolyngbyaceae cyanobacterium M65_K2018_010]
MTDYHTFSHGEMLERVRALEGAVEELRDRNRRVEREKAWETSLTRRMLLVVLTYGITALVFWKIAVPSPLSDALIPSTGYIISTLTVPWAKQAWLARRYQQ